MAIEKTLLYVDGRKQDCDKMKFVFERAGYRVVTCRSAARAMRQVRSGGLAAIVVEHSLEDMCGSDLGRWVRVLDPVVPIIVFTRAAGETGPTSRGPAADVVLVEQSELEGILPLLGVLIRKSVRKRQRLNRRRFLSAYDLSITKIRSSMRIMPEQQGK